MNKINMIPEPLYNTGGYVLLEVREGKIYLQGKEMKRPDLWRDWLSVAIKSIEN